MTYLGREIWLFLAEYGRPGALYSVSGRSKASREREAVYYQEERRVAIEPLDKSQNADPLRNYNAMRFDDSSLVISNGLHTEDIFGSREIVALRRFLNKWGPEPDSLRTPRIAGIVKYPILYLGMITEDKNAESIIISPIGGTAYGVSTYSGKGIEPEPFDISRLSKQDMLPNVRLEGKTAEEVADFFVTKVIDPEFFVCCSSALWYEDLKEWEIAILNKSG